MFISGAIDTPLIFILVISAILLAMGLVFETLSMVLIMTPVLLPAALAMGLDPIWFGIYMVVMVECALITPPVGLNLYVIQSVARSSLGDVSSIFGRNWFCIPPLKCELLTMTQSAPDKLRALLQQDRLHVMPCCFDALSAKLIEQEGFGLTFMSGFATSASRIGAPDLGLMS